MSFGENKGVWISVGAALLLLATLIWLLVSGGPTSLVILFPDTGDLKRDDPVIWHDYLVGRVVKIEPLVENQIGVTIRLNEDYANRITRGSSFTLKRAALFGFVGRNAVEIETPAEAGAPYADGEKIQGTAPRPTLVEQGKQLTVEYWQQLKDQASALMEEYQRSPYRKDIEDAVAQLKSLAEKGMKQAKEGLAQFRQDHQQELDSVMKKLEQARDWMSKNGDERGARRIQEQIDKLLRGQRDK